MYICISVSLIHQQSVIIFVSDFFLCLFTLLFLCEKKRNRDISDSLFDMQSFHVSREYKSPSLEPSYCRLTILDGFLLIL